MYKRQRGYILLVCLVLLGILAIAAMATTDSNIGGQRMTQNAEQKAKSFECAEGLRATLSDIWSRAAAASDFGKSAGGTLDDALFDGAYTGSKYLKMMGSDLYPSADPRPTSSNDIPFLDKSGKPIAESLARPVRLRDDAQWVDASGKVYAEAGIYKNAVHKVAGTAMGQGYGYGSRGYNAAEGMHVYFLMRSESTGECSSAAKTVLESDYRYVIK